MLFIYGVALLAEFLAPFPPNAYAVKYTYAPPQRLHLFEHTKDGFRFNPHVLGYQSTVDPVALRRTFVIDGSQIIPIRLFVKGEPYKLFGLVPATVRLIGPVDKSKPMYLFGADRLGRDVFSRMIYGTRISISIGLVGVAISLVLGTVLGGISGYCGGQIDLVHQRIIVVIRSVPTIPVLLGLSSVPPRN